MKEADDAEGVADGFAWTVAWGDSRTTAVISAD